MARPLCRGPLADGPFPIIFGPGFSREFFRIVRKSPMEDSSPFSRLRLSRFSVKLIMKSRSDGLLEIIVDFRRFFTLSLTWDIAILNKFAMFFF